MCFCDGKYFLITNKSTGEKHLIDGNEGLHEFFNCFYSLPLLFHRYLKREQVQFKDNFYTISCRKPRGGNTEHFIKPKYEETSPKFSVMITGCPTTVSVDLLHQGYKLVKSTYLEKIYLVLCYNKHLNRCCKGFLLPDFFIFLTHVK